MNTIQHHIPDAMLAAYASGSLPHAFSLIVASHISICDASRAALTAHQMAGGAVLDTMEGVAPSDTLKADIMARLDDPVPDTPVYERRDVLPAPVVQAMANRPIKWKRLGMGVRQDIIHAGPDGSVRLLYIPGGQAVPDHGHNGMELTLVLQGSFSDETGQFGVGDVEIADEHLDHTPIADEGEACICLAATDAPLRFHEFMPRLLQPLFRI